MYDITVLTLVSQGKKEYLRNEVTFYRVGTDVRTFVSESCGVTLGRLRQLPECVSADAWHLKYRTVVKLTGTHTIISDTRLITFPGMSWAQMQDFRQWAIGQLNETLTVIDEETGPDVCAPEFRKRNWIWTVLKMLWTRK